MALVGWVLALVIGCAATYFVARRVAHRPRLSITLTPKVSLFPSDFDIGESFSFRMGGRAVDNVCALELVVKCKGFRDIVVPDARPPRAADATPLPRLDFTDFDIMGIQTLNNDASKFYVPLVRAAKNKSLYVNIHRLKAGTEARFQIVGRLLEERRTFTDDQCQIFPGAIQDTDVDISGCVQAQTLRE